MPTTLRKTLKVAGWSFSALFTLLCIFLGLLAFPGFLFAHDAEAEQAVARPCRDAD